MVNFGFMWMKTKIYLCKYKPLDTRNTEKCQMQKVQRETNGIRNMSINQTEIIPRVEKKGSSPIQWFYYIYISSYIISDHTMHYLSYSN